MGAGRWEGPLGHAPPMNPLQRSRTSSQLLLGTVPRYPHSLPLPEGLQAEFELEGRVPGFPTGFTDKAVLESPKNKPHKVSPMSTAICNCDQLSRTLRHEVEARLKTFSLQSGSRTGPWQRQRP